MAQFRFFQQPPTARNRILDAVGIFEKVLRERRRGRRRINANLVGWFVYYLFKLF
jgi:hypothetical protein